MPVETLSRPRQEVVPQPQKEINEAINHGIGYFRTIEVPMTKIIPQIQDALRTHDTILMVGQTGSGKSTVGPLVVMDSILKQNPEGKVILTQPRRGTAKKIADTFEEHVGSHYTGYRYKEENTIRPQTQLEIRMERSVLNEMMDDPLLRNYDAIILDEIHEGSLDIEILLPLLKDAQKERRQLGLKPLKVVLASATLDTGKYLGYFNNAALLQAEGRMYEVVKHFAERNVSPDEAPDVAADLLTQLIESGAEGNFQVFLHGKQAIEKSMKRFKDKMPESGYRLEMHMGGTAGNLEAIQRAASEKTILWTSPAGETGFTTPNLQHVIDAGHMNTNKNVGGIDILVTEETTQGNSLQRAGRTGRVGKGHVYYLFTEEDFNRRKAHIEPQINNADISLQFLQLKNLNKDMGKIGLLNPPSEEQINFALAKLQNLGAIDEAGDITDDGKRMLRSEVDLEYARMLIEAEKRGCQREVALLVGALSSEGSFFDFDFKKGVSFKEKYQQFIDENEPHNDFLTILNIWNEFVDNFENKRWGIENGIKTSDFGDAMKTARDLLKSFSGRISYEKIDVSGDNMKKINESLTSGLINNIVSKVNSEYRTMGGIAVRVDKNSAVYGGSVENFLSGKFTYNKSLKAVFARYNMELNEESVKGLASPDEEIVQEVSKQSETIEKPETPKQPSSKTFTPIIHTPNTLHYVHKVDTTAEIKRNLFQKIGYTIKKFVDNILRALRLRR